MSTTFRERRGAHRPRGLGPAAAIPWLLAAVAVAAIVMFVSGWLGGSGGPEATGESTPPAAGATPGATPSPSGSGPGAQPSATLSSTVTGTSGAPSTSSGTVDRSVSVAVLNSTTRAGLASGAAGRLRVDGWTIRSTGNYRVPARTTTVLYGRAGLAATAEAVAKALGGSAVSESAEFGSSRLTVVLGADYQQ